MCQPAGLGEGDYNNRNPAPVEFRLVCFHLAEVVLTGQSGEVSEKNHQQVGIEVSSQLSGPTLEIQQRQTIDGDLLVDRS